MNVEDETPDSALKTVESWCRERAKPIIAAWLETTGALPVLLCNDERDPVKGFLSACEEYQVDVVAINTTRLTEGTWEQKRAEVSNGGCAEGVAEKLTIIERLKSMVGRPAAVEVRAISRAHRLVLGVNVNADWFDFVYSGTVGEGDNWLEEEEALPSPDIREVEKKIARDLANNQDFQRAKNYGQREYVLKRELNDTGTDVSVDRILQEADIVLELEVRPKLEAENRKIARKLRADGWTQAAIAEELQVSLHKVRQLVGAGKRGSASHD